MLSSQDQFLKNDTCNSYGDSVSCNGQTKDNVYKNQYSQNNHDNTSSMDKARL